MSTQKEAFILLPYTTTTPADRVRYSYNGKVILFDNDGNSEFPYTYMVMEIDQYGGAISSTDGLTIEDAQELFNK